MIAVDWPLTLLDTQFKASGVTQAFDRIGRVEMFGRLFSSLPDKAR
jgi:hypothetical protein